MDYNLISFIIAMHWALYALQRYKHSGNLFGSGTNKQSFVSPALLVTIATLKGLEMRILSA